MNTKLKCLLLDDEIPGLTYLKMLCEQLPELEIVKAYNSPELFLKELPQHEFDLCILDVEMPGMDGLGVANFLNGKPVIFVTAYTEYAAEAFDLNAVDYIRKPVKIERLKQAVQKAMDRFALGKPTKKYIVLNTDKGKTLVFFDQVNYISTSTVDSRDKIASLVDGTSITIKNTSFEKLLILLPSSLFCRINKREIVALHCIQFFSYDEITTNITQANGKNLILTLNEVYRSDFIQKIKL